MLQGEKLLTFSRNKMKKIMDGCSNLQALMVAFILMFAISKCPCSAVVHEINSKTVDKFMSGKFFVVTFVDSPTCTRCRSLFPFFVAASQAFPNDPEIFFTRTHDKKLIEAWGVKELPKLIYHREGLSNHEDLGVDVTVDDIIDQIARTLHGNFGSLTRTYCVHLESSNYEEMVVTPKQSTLILIHDKKDKEDVVTFEKVAYAFRKDDGILLATLDVSRQKNLRDEKFMTKDTPTIMWLHVTEKNKPKRFGGVRSTELLVEFINERTGLLRDHDGAMQKEAGRLSQADDVINQHLGGLLEGDGDDLKAARDKLNELKQTELQHHHEMLDYYQYTIDRLAHEGSDVIKGMISAIDLKLFGSEEASTKTQETLKRRKNILFHFQDLIKQYGEEKEKQGKEALDEKIKAAMKKRDGGTAGHAHVHTEL